MSGVHVGPTSGLYAIVFEASTLFLLYVGWNGWANIRGNSSRDVWNTNKRFPIGVWQ